MRPALRILEFIKRLGPDRRAVIAAVLSAIPASCHLLAEVDEELPRAPATLPIPEGGSSDAGGDAPESSSGDASRIGFGLEDATTAEAATPTNEPQPPTPPSCGAATVGTGTGCGPSQRESCCAARKVPGGQFYRSSSLDYAATVSSFWFDRFEVTVGRFRAFLDAGFGTQRKPPRAGQGAHEKIADSGWNASWNEYLELSRTELDDAIAACGEHTYTQSLGENDALPMNCITWFEAFAFCAWDGGRLPSEAEWNYAAAGGDEQRTYPWGGIPISSERANIALVSGGVGAPLRPGSFSPKGDGRFGHADLAGNLSELLLDSEGNYQNPCNDCALLGSWERRILRGGSYYQMSQDIRFETSFRESAFVLDRSRERGLRCARAFPE